MAESRRIGGSLDMVRVTRPGGFLVHLSGVIDGTFDRRAFVAALHGVLVFELYGVRRITFQGVREWMLALEALESPAYYFIRVRTALLAQFNAVANFGGRGQLVSFYAPYQCTVCRKKVRALIDLTQHEANVRALESPPAACVHCGGKAELDDDPESVFAYVASAPSRPIPPVVSSIISSAWGGTELRFSIKKVVRGHVTAIWLSGPLDHTAQFGRLGESLKGTVVILMRGIWSATDKGVARLGAFLKSAPATVYIARLPLPMLFALSKTPTACGKARVVSVRLPARCGTCHDEVEMDLDGMMLQRMAQDALVRPACPECGDLLTGFPQETLRAAMALPLAPIPEELRPHLRDRARPLVRPVKVVDDDDPTQHTLTPTLQSGEPGKAPEAPPQPTAKHLGRYELGRRIGISAVVTEYLARERVAEDQTPVVLKVLHPHLAREPAFVDALAREAAIASKVLHPNLIRTFGLESEGSTHYVVGDFIDGARLGEVLRMLNDDGKLPQPDMSLRIMIDVLLGIGALHEAGLIHSGLMPMSLLIGLDGVTRVADLELARTRSQLAVTKGGARLRLGYLSPEQLRHERLDRRSDIYSAAVVLWELLAGPLHEAGRGRSPVPTPIGDVCLQALQPDPDKRYPTAHSFAVALEEASRAAQIASASPYHVAALVRRFKSVGG